MAIEHPEEYSDLVVRIGGYSDYFTRIPAGMQQELLLRTEHLI
jgi:formate C-acetyltransferase